MRCTLGAMPGKLLAVSARRAGRVPRRPLSCSSRGVVGRGRKRHQAEPSEVWRQSDSGVRGKLDQTLGKKKPRCVAEATVRYISSSLSHVDIASGV